MKILLTGCAGFIASKTAELLLQQGHQVVGIDNLNDAYDTRLKDYRLSELKALSGFEFHRGDIANFDDLKPIFEAHQFDAVMNLAARAGVRQSIANPWVYVETNTTGTLNLLEMCKNFEVKQFLLASTSSLYGDHCPKPFSEDAITDRPLSPYAASKKGAEAMLATYHHLYKINATIVRYFTVYGPAGRPDMSVFRFIRWIAEDEPITIFGDGSQERDFTYIDDIAKGSIAGLNVKGIELVNLGSDKPHSLAEMIATIEKYLGKKAKTIHKPFHPADVQGTWANINKARSMLQWEPKTFLDEGIKKTVEWYLSNRAWAKHIHLGDV